ncbi:MAG: DinB family protein [Chloroflexota bacterium]
MRSSEQRARLIESYGDAFAELTDALKEFPREMWGYRGQRDPWTIHEVVVHIADSEANSFVRARRFIAEPGKDVMAYDESAWANALNYAEQDPDDAIQLFRWLRGNTHNLIKVLPENTWSNTIYHPENGTMTMDDWLDIYESHVRDHVGQMREIYEEWKAGSK